jgi:hypothetical protein
VLVCVARSRAYCLIGLIERYEVERFEMMDDFQKKLRTEGKEVSWLRLHIKSEFVYRTYNKTAMQTYKYIVRKWEV